MERIKFIVYKDGNFAHTVFGKYKGDYFHLCELIKLFDYEDYVKLIAGDAIETIPIFRDQNPEMLVSFAYVDFDLYEPVMMALNFLENVISIGGLIVFDEAIDSRWPGETIAMKEFLSESKHEFKMINNHLTRQPTMALMRVK